MKAFIRSFYFFGALLLVACFGDDEDPLGELILQQDETITEFLDARGQIYELTEAGVYIVRQEEGTNEEVQLDKVLETVLTCSVFDGDRFYENLNYTFSPSIIVLVPGMVDAVEQMTVGETVKLFIPSTMGLGPQANTINGVNIPPNSILVMDLFIRAMRTQEEQDTFERDTIESFLEKEELAFEQITVTTDTVIYKSQLVEPTPLSEIPESGRTVVVDYTLTNLEGTNEFDSGTDFSFQIDGGSVIPGFNTGVLNMQTGERAFIVLTSRAAYGAEGTSNIGPYTVLKFEIELKEVIENN